MDSSRSNVAEIWIAAATVVLAAAAIVAAFLAPSQIREARRSRRAQAIMTVYAEWASSHMQEARMRLRSFGDSNQLLKAMTPPTKDAYLLLRVPNFIETLAVLVDAGAVEYDLVRKIYGSDIRRYWDLWEPVISFAVEQEGQSSMYEAFGALASRLEADANQDSR